MVPARLCPPLLESTIVNPKDVVNVLKKLYVNGVVIMKNKIPIMNAFVHFSAFVDGGVHLVGRDDIIFLREYAFNFTSQNLFLHSQMIKMIFFYLGIS